MLEHNRSVENGNNESIYICCIKLECEKARSRAPYPFGVSGLLPRLVKQHLGRLPGVDLFLPGFDPLIDVVDERFRMIAVAWGEFPAPRAQIMGLGTRIVCNVHLAHDRNFRDP